MSEFERGNQLRVPKRLLTGWANKPECLGAWVDLALEDAETEGRQSWTESELGRRWGSRWDPDEVRAWLGEAIALELVEPTSEGDRWRLRGRRGPEVERPPARIRFSGPTSAEDAAGQEAGVDRSDLSFDLQELLSIEELERAYVLFVLESCSNNKLRAANVLQIDPSTLHRKLRRWDRRS
jgi:hypothetical protein